MSPPGAWRTPIPPLRKPKHQGRGSIAFGPSCVHLCRCSHPAPTQDEQRALSTPSSSLLRSKIFLGWTPKGPELKLQSSIPSSSACEAALCSSVEQREEQKIQDFLPFGEHLRAFTQLHFSGFICCSNVEQNRESFLWALIFFTAYSSHSIVFLQSWWIAGMDGWRLQRSSF